MKDEIKYAYLRDTKNTSRVLTIARKLVPCDDPCSFRLHVGWSLNKQPNPSVDKALHMLKSIDQCTILVAQQDFDHYDKKEGRAWADKRLQEDPIVVDVPDKVRPFDQVILALFDHPNYYVRRIVRQFVADVKNYSNC